jgi:hypothetical protein
MAHELVITSVRKGLDGGSGYQPVLRTRGMKPAVAERLQLRSGYSHPYSHGDRRNPVVFVHRIERVAGETLHVLARICDAGSDHTGRSNFLAHLVSLDSGEARRKSGGPAEVAQRLAFKTSWNEPPREADPPVVIGGDRAPGRCGAWQAARLDPGIAGDLAQAAVSGSEVRLVVREGEDVLALFADALALVPPAKRWQVTFNTCEIEPFDAMWRAVREDLRQARDFRGSRGVIDLTRPGVRGSDGAYARFARGEVGSLPWQEAPAPTSAGGAEPAAAGTPQAPVTTPPGRTTAATAPPSATPGAAPPKPGKRSLAPPPPRPTEETRDAGSPLVARVVWVLAGLLVLVLVVGVVVIAVNPTAQSRVLALFGGSDAELAALPDGGDAGFGEGFEMGASEREERLRKQEREKAEAETKQGADAERNQRTAAAAERQAKADADRTAQEKQRAKERDERNRQAAADRRREAFEALTKLPDRIDLPVPGGMDGGTPPAILIGAVAVEDLDELSFQMAVPRENVAGAPFKATVEREGDATSRTWMIRAAPDLSVDKSAKPIDLARLAVKDGQLSVQPVSKPILANARYSLLRRSVLLVLARDPSKPDSKPVERRAIQLLVPSRQPPTDPVHLLTKDGDGPRPTTVMLKAPPAITVSQEASASLPALPPSSTTIEFEVAFDYRPDGQKSQEKYSSTLTSGSFNDGVATWFCALLTCPADPTGPKQPSTMIGVEATTSLAQATVRITPTVQGPASKQFALAGLGPLVLQSDEKYEKSKADKTSSEQKDLDRLCKSNVEVFDINASAKFTGKWRENIEKYFRRIPGPPDAREIKDNGRVVGETSAFDVWVEECESVRNDLASLNSPKDRPPPDRYSLAYKAELKKLNNRWQAKYAERLRAWFEDYKIRRFADYDRARDGLQPLKSPARVSIARVASVAVAPDGTEYRVELIVPRPVGEPAAHAPAERSTDIE